MLLFTAKELSLSDEGLSLLLMLSYAYHSILALTFKKSKANVKEMLAA